MYTYIYIYVYVYIYMYVYIYIYCIFHAKCKIQLCTAHFIEGDLAEKLPNCGSQSPPAPAMKTRLMGNIPGGGMSRSASLARLPAAPRCEQQSSGTCFPPAEVINLMLTMLEVNKKSLPEGDFRIVPCTGYFYCSKKLLACCLLHKVKMAQQVENDYIGNLFAKSDAWVCFLRCVLSEHDLHTKSNDKPKEYPQQTETKAVDKHAMSEICFFNSPSHSRGQRRACRAESQHKHFMKTAFPKAFAFTSPTSCGSWRANIPEARVKGFSQRTAAHLILNLIYLTFIIHISSVLYITYIFCAISTLHLHLHLQEHYIIIIIIIIINITNIIYVYLTYIIFASTYTFFHQTAIYMTYIIYNTYMTYIIIYITTSSASTYIL